jgi:hypothetical protein
VNVGVGGEHVFTDTKEANCVSVTTDPGSVVVPPWTKIVVVNTVVTPGKLVVIVAPAAVIVVTLPGKVVDIVCIRVVPGKVIV